MTFKHFVRYVISWRFRAYWFWLVWLTAVTIFCVATHDWGMACVSAFLTVLFE